MEIFPHINPFVWTHQLPQDSPHKEPIIQNFDIVLSEQALKQMVKLLVIWDIKTTHVTSP